MEEFTVKWSDEAPKARKVLQLYAKHLIEIYGGNKSMAAKILGIDRRSLYRLLGEVNGMPRT